MISVPCVWAGGGPNVSGAKLYIQQNNLADAIRVLKKEVEKVNPKNEDAWYLLGYIYARQGKYEQMMDAFNKAVELKPKLREKGVKVNRDTGKQFFAQFGTDMIIRIVWGNIFNKAVTYFNNGITATSDSVSKANYAQAVSYFESAVQLQPDSVLAYRNWAAALMNMGKYEESVVPLKETIKRNPKDYDARTMLASVYATTGQDSLAIALLQELWNEGHRTTDVMDYLSRLYIKTKKMDDAVAIFKDALEQNPENYELHYNYGVVLLETNQFDQAIEQFTEAYAMKPDSPDLNYNLGAAYLNRGVAKREKLPEDSEDKAYMKDFELALPHLEKSVMLNPDDEQVWLTLGRIAGQLNKISLAGYALSKSEDERSALHDQIVVGMPSSTLKQIFGEPDQVTPIESDNLSGIEEWIYKKRRALKGKPAIDATVNVYVQNDRVDALMVVE